MIYNVTTASILHLRTGECKKMDKTSIRPRDTKDRVARHQGRKHFVGTLLGRTVSERRLGKRSKTNQPRLRRLLPKIHSPDIIRIAPLHAERDRVYGIHRIAPAASSMRSAERRLNPGIVISVLQVRLLTKTSRSQESLYHKQRHNGQTFPILQ